MSDVRDTEQPKWLTDYAEEFRKDQARELELIDILHKKHPEVLEYIQLILKRKRL